MTAALQDVVPVALVDELREELDHYERATTLARRQANEAVDLSQLMVGWETQRRAARAFTRLLHKAEGASLALGLGYSAAWDALLDRPGQR